MTDLTQAVIHREGSIEIILTDKIVMKHRGDKVILRGPLHAMVKMTRPNGKEKGSEELVLRSASDTRDIACMENPSDQYDITIIDLGPLPAQPTLMDLIVDKKHVDVISSGGFTAYHPNDMIRLRGPAHLHVEFRGKTGNVRRAEDITLATPQDIRDFLNRSGEEDMVIRGSHGGTATPAPTMAPPAMPAPAAGGAFAQKYPDGTLVKAANNDTVYVMEGGVKRPVTGEAFAKYGYKWDAIRTIPDGDIFAIPTGPVKG